MASAALAIEVPPIPLSFAENIGQEVPGVLFSDERRKFLRDGVELQQGLRIQFTGGTPAEVSGKGRFGFPLHRYLGNDPNRWRENIPHYATVRYAGIHPGIDVEWNTGAGLAMVRIMAAPGVDVRRLVIRLSQQEAELRWTNFTSSIIVWSAGFFRFDKLVAYQLEGDSKRQLAARFEDAGADSFRIAVDNPDPSSGVAIEIGEPYVPYLYYNWSVASGSDGTLLSAGAAASGYFARVDSAGRPLFVTLLDAQPGLVGDREGVTVSGEVHQGQPTWPTTADAPRRVATERDSWMGRFDGSGRLRSATFLGGAPASIVVGPGGAVYFSASDRIGKWVPGRPQWEFTVPMPLFVSLSVDASGALAFAGFATPGQPVTPGALQSQPQGRHDVYAGKLDATTGALRMATYLPVFGKSPEILNPSPVVTLAPNGSLWIASIVRATDGGSAQTLIGLTASGSRIFYSAAFPGLPSISFDSRGNALVVVSPAPAGLPTTAAVTRRSPCREGVYLRILSPDGAMLEANYLAGFGRVVGFDGPERLNITPFSSSFSKTVIERVDTNPAPNREIACIVHAASRQLRGFGGGAPMAPGGLYTIIGNQLGPLEERVSAEMPSRLGEIEVRIGGEAVPLYSVQQGLITFYLPETTPRTSVDLEVVERGAVIAKVTVAITASIDYSTFSADGSGYGRAAAVNQDGSVNARDNPARWGSVVSIFGAGPMSSDPRWRLSGVNSGFLQGVLTPDYAGPAPNSLPGAKQINLRLPSAVPNLGRGWVFVGPAAPGPALGTVIYVGP